VNIPFLTRRADGDAEQRTIPDDLYTPPAPVRTPAPKYFIGVDLAQQQDFTAVLVLEQHGAVREGATYHARWAERWRGVSYPEQVERLRTLKATPPLTQATLIVDATGVGRAVLDMLQAARLYPHAVTIHGGETVTRVHQAEQRVPKRDLVATVAVALQQGRLKVAAELPHAAVLTAELQTFKMTIDPKTAHDSYAAWREADHDDLVLGLAVALWWAESQVAPMAW
jgi:phage FluMu gp28-like protein